MGAEQSDALKVLRNVTAYALAEAAARYLSDWARS